MELTQHGISHSVLPGDSLRLGFNRELGFDQSDWVENIRSTAEAAKLMADSGPVVLISQISTYEADRESAGRNVIGERFVEDLADTPIEVCEERDPKGFYSKARKSLIPNFTSRSKR